MTDRPPLAIELTPLGQARKAIDAALSDIEHTMEAWREENENDPPNDDYPHGDYELTLRPDSGSYGFVALFEYSETVGPDADDLERKLRPLLVKHGIATVSVVGTNLDTADVEAFNE